MQILLLMLDLAVKQAFLKKPPGFHSGKTYVVSSKGDYRLPIDMGSDVADANDNAGEGQSMVIKHFTNLPFDNPYYG